MFTGAAGAGVDFLPPPHITCLLSLPALAPEAIQPPDPTRSSPCSCSPWIPCRPLDEPPCPACRCSDYSRTSSAAWEEEGSCCHPYCRSTSLRPHGCSRRTGQLRPVARSIARLRCFNRRLLLLRIAGCFREILIGGRCRSRRRRRLLTAATHLRSPYAARMNPGFNTASFSPLSHTNRM